MSSIAFSKKVALRYLWSKRSEAFITILTYISIIGIAIGVMVINITMSIMTGFQYELREKIVGADSHIIVRRLGGKIEDWRNIISSLEKQQGVVSASGFTLSQVLLRANDKSNGILIRGIDPKGSSAAELTKYLDSNQDIAEALSPKPVNITDEDGTQRVVDLPGILVGRELTKNMALILGDTVSLFSPNVTSTPFGLVPRYKRFVISGTYSSGLTEYESGLAYMDLKDAQSFFRLGDTINGIEVRVKNIEQSYLVAKDLTENLLRNFGGGFYAEDWSERNRPLWEAMQFEKRVYFWVLLLLIVMASFSVISTLIMIVLEKRRDIAILRTLGASARSIAHIFIIQGTVIGILGVSFGLALGYFGSLGLRAYGFPLNEPFPLSTVPVRIELFNFAVVGVFSFLICLLATIYPAYRASRLHPIEVLRYE